MEIDANRGISVRSTKDGGYEWNGNFGNNSYKHYFEENLLKETAYFYEQKINEW